MSRQCAAKRHRIAMRRQHDAPLPANQERGVTAAIGLFGLAALLDRDYLATTVHAAGRADMVTELLLAAAAARHQIEFRNPVMAAAVALPVPADSLLG